MELWTHGCVIKSVLPLYSMDSAVLWLLPKRLPVCHKQEMNMTFTRAFQAFGISAQSKETDFYTGKQSAHNINILNSFMFFLK